MKTLSDTSLAKLLSIIRNAIKNITPEDIKAANAVHSHAVVTTNSNGFMSSDDKRNLGYVLPFLIGSADGVNYSANNYNIPTSTLVGATLIVIPDTTSTSTQCKFSLHGAPSYPIKVRAAGETGGLAYPESADWMKAGIPFRLMNGGTVWIADVG